MTVRIQLADGKLTVPEVRFLLVGSTGESLTANPQALWLSEKSWQQIVALEKEFPGQFSGLVKQFENNDTATQWKKVFEATTPE